MSEVSEKSNCSLQSDVSVGTEVQSNLSMTVEFPVEFEVSKILWSNNTEFIKISWSFGDRLELIITLAS